ncbi:SH3 domain-containing protein [Nitrosomonas aestuarii]|uniref:SH3 domain-containing protein n=1 Tax=Nitrosomonas aestuarii TaxID=52441 RepID=UPI001481A492|nr:SH3 domain-containing protein [Nitrosomonas aestuarii]
MAIKEPPEPLTKQHIEQIPVSVHQQQIDSMRIIIEQLAQKLAEKEALIKQISAREQDQTQIIQASSKEIAHTQVRLRRLATKPSSASLIAEAEVAMAYIKQQSTLIPSDTDLYEQAKRLLDMAVFYYRRDNYANATYYASQALEFMNMIADQDRALPNRVTIRFNTPIMLLAIADANLRRAPGRHALIIDVLEKGTVLTANAYQGNWLMVQTDDDREGWIFNTLVETMLDKKH